MLVCFRIQNKISISKIEQFDVGGAGTNTTEGSFSCRRVHAYCHYDDDLGSSLTVPPFVVVVSARNTTARDETVPMAVTSTANKVPLAPIENWLSFRAVSARTLVAYRRVANSNRNAPFPINIADAKCTCDNKNCCRCCC